MELTFSLRTQGFDLQNNYTTAFARADCRGGVCMGSVDDYHQKIEENEIVLDRNIFVFFSVNGKIVLPLHAET